MLREIRVCVKLIIGDVVYDFFPYYLRKPRQRVYQPQYFVYEVSVSRTGKRKKQMIYQEERNATYPKRARKYNTLFIHVCEETVPISQPVSNPLP